MPRRPRSRRLRALTRRTRKVTARAFVCAFDRLIQALPQPTKTDGVLLAQYERSNARRAKLGPIRLIGSKRAGRECSLIIQAAKTYSFLYLRTRWESL